MLITFEREVPQRPDKCQNDHKSRGYLSKTSLQHVLYKMKIKRFLTQYNGQICNETVIWKNHQKFKFLTHPHYDFFNNKKSILKASLRDISTHRPDPSDTCCPVKIQQFSSNTEWQMCLKSIEIGT